MIFNINLLPERRTFEYTLTASARAFPDSERTDVIESLTLLHTLNASVQRYSDDLALHSACLSSSGEDLKADTSNTEVNPATDPAGSLARRRRRYLLDAWGQTALRSMALVMPEFKETMAVLAKTCRRVTSFDPAIEVIEDCLRAFSQRFPNALELRHSQGHSNYGATRPDHRMSNGVWIQGAYADGHLVATFDGAIRSQAVGPEVLAFLEDLLRKIFEALQPVAEWSHERMIEILQEQCGVPTSQASAPPEDSPP